jgi:hypothetical protein
LLDKRASVPACAVGVILRKNWRRADILLLIFDTRRQWQIDIGVRLID